MTEIDKHGRPSVNIVLVGNKSDLSSKRVVKTERARVWHFIWLPRKNIKNFNK